MLFAEQTWKCEWNNHESYTVSIPVTILSFASTEQHVIVPIANANVSVLLYYVNAIQNRTVSFCNLNEKIEIKKLKKKTSESRH